MNRSLHRRGLLALSKDTRMPRPIVELRQYTLRTGRRDEFIALFEREFIDSQEACGIRLLAIFRDLDDVNRVAWMRSFPDMPARATALTAFYGGEVWKAHRDAANACILDSDNVLMLHPLAGEDGVVARPAPRAAMAAAEIRYLDRAAAPAFADFYATHMRPRIEQAGAQVLASFETDPSPNNFRLPVRESETVLVSLLGFSDEAAHAAYRDRLMRGEDWRQAAPEALLGQFARKPEVLRLSPTPRSPLRA